MINDKIYELARQADLIEFEPVGDSDNWTPSYESIVKARKFAELIVRECASIVDQPYDFKTPPDQKTYRYPLSGDEVLKHFGVEE